MNFAKFFFTNLATDIKKLFLCQEFRSFVAAIVSIGVVTCGLITVFCLAEGFPTPNFVLLGDAIFVLSMIVLYIYNKYEQYKTAKRD